VFHHYECWIHFCHSNRENTECLAFSNKGTSSGGALNGYQYNGAAGASG
jgi:hypothetical protein